MLNVNDVRQYFIDELAAKRFVTDKTGVKTIEMVAAQFVVDEPSIFGKVNKDYVRREMDWYKSMSRNVYDIEPPVPEIWKSVADKDGNINSNYGWCVYSEENYNQYERLIDELKKNPDSRRAILIYTRPSIWVDFDEGGRSDFICTNACQYLIRDGKLVSIVSMRSNDAIYGFKNDAAWQMYIHQLIADELLVEKGDLIWNAGSLHVYERHFDLVRNEPHHWNRKATVNLK